MENKKTVQLIDKVTALKATMQRELVFMGEFNHAYEAVRAHIQNKDWTDLQKALKESGRISQDIALLEEKRQAIAQDLYLTIGLPQDRNFLEAVPFFPEDLREESKSIYFHLRAEVYRMRCRLKSLEVYVRVRMELVKTVMNKAQLTQKSGDPYKRVGRRAMHDPDSFLFDSIK